jgi:thiamine phosphate synthase YjbQ (UPF0047 family)
MIPFKTLCNIQEWTLNSTPNQKGCHSYISPHLATRESDDEGSENDVENKIESSVDVCLPQHVRCYAHSLQLVVKDGLKECNSHLKQVVTKVSHIVNYVRKSVNASEILEDYSRLQAANVTRWNSQLYMLRSILNVPEDERNKTECKLSCPLMKESF